MTWLRAKRRQSYTLWILFLAVTLQAMRGSLYLSGCAVPCCVCSCLPCQGGGTSSGQLVKTPAWVDQRNHDAFDRCPEKAKQPMLGKAAAQGHPAVRVHQSSRQLQLAMHAGYMCLPFTDIYASMQAYMLSMLQHSIKQHWWHHCPAVYTHMWQLMHQQPTWCAHQGVESMYATTC